MTSIFPMLQLTSSTAIRDHGALGALAEHGVAATSDGGAVGALFFGRDHCFLGVSNLIDGDADQLVTTFPVLQLTIIIAIGNELALGALLQTPNLALRGRALGAELVKRFPLDVTRRDTT
jgi:hypothetical protein